MLLKTYSVSIFQHTQLSRTRKLKKSVIAFETEYTNISDKCTVGLFKNFVQDSIQEGRRGLEATNSEIDQGFFKGYLHQGLETCSFGATYGSLAFNLQLFMVRVNIETRKTQEN